MNLFCYLLFSTELGPSLTALKCWGVVDGWFGTQAWASEKLGTRWAWRCPPSPFLSGSFSKRDVLGLVWMSTENSLVQPPLSLLVVMALEKRWTLSLTGSLVERKTANFDLDQTWVQISHLILSNCGLKELVEIVFALLSSSISNAFLIGFSLSPSGSGLS